MYQNTAGPNATSAQVPAIRRVHRELDDQEKAIHISHNVLDTLVERLNSVLGPSNPVPSGVDAKDIETSHVGTRVERHTRGINAATQRISELIERLEI